MRKNKKRQQVEPVETKAQSNKPTTIVSKLQVRTVNRKPKTIRTWRSAHVTAENLVCANRVALYDLYDDVMLDGHLTGITGKRFDGVLNKALHFERNKKRVDEMDDLIESDKFRQIVRTIMETMLWGISGIEFIPGQQLSYKIVPRKHIKPELGIIATEEYGNTGDAYADYPNIWIMGNESDLGLLLKCSPYALYKRGNWGDWSQYVEIFGMPVRVIYYDAHDDQTSMELDKILEESGSALALKVPKQAQFEMKDGKQSNGDGRLQDTFKDALNAELSVLILGNTETTTNGKTGTGAKSEIHQDQQLEITKSDLVYVRNMLNSPEFLAILKSYGYPVEGGKFVFTKEVDMKQIGEKLSIIERVKKLGVPVADEHIYEVSGVPKPDNYDELKAQQQAAAYDDPDEDEDEEEDEVPKQVRKPNKKPQEKPRNFWRQLRAMLTNPRSFFVPAPTTGHLMTELDNLYSTRCPDCGGLHISNQDEADAFSSIIDGIAIQLYEKKLKEGVIPEELYRKTANELMTAVFDGLGAKAFQYDDPRNDLATYFQHNIHAFSAAKSLTEMKHMRGLLVDDQGRERGKEAFRNACTDAGYTFNKNYLETERVTALATTQGAVLYDSFGEDDTLEISTVGDEHVRPAHAQLDGFTAPKSDPVWLKLWPPFDWFCRCTVVPGVASRASDRNRAQMIKDAEVPKYFQRNPAVNKEVFSDGHSYYSHAGAKLKELAAEANYNMPSAAKLYADGGFPPAIEVADKAEANAWWKDKAGDLRGSFDVQDVTGLAVRFSKKFKNHVFEDNQDERWKYIANVDDIMQKPDEVWSYKEKGVLWKSYIKYYEGYPQMVRVNGTEAVSFWQFEKDGKLNESSVAKSRRGALLYRKN